MTAPGEIRFEFVTEGEEQFSSVLLDLKTKQVQASSAATDLARELAKLKASGELSAEGVQAVQRQLAAAQLAAQRFGQEATQAARAEQTLARESTTAAGASRNHARGQAEVVNMISEMSLGLGGLSPQLRELTTAFAGGANNAVQLAGSMGPIGIAIGLLGSLIPTLISNLAGAGDQARETAEATREAASAFDQLVSSMRAANEQQSLLSGIGVQGSAVRSALGDTQIERRAAQQQFEQALQDFVNNNFGSSGRASTLAMGRGDFAALARRADLLGLENTAEFRAAQDARRHMEELDRQLTELEAAARRAEGPTGGSRFGAAPDEIGALSPVNRARRLREREEANADQGRSAGHAATQAARERLRAKEEEVREGIRLKELEATKEREAVERESARILEVKRREAEEIARAKRAQHEEEEQYRRKRQREDEEAARTAERKLAEVKKQARQAEQEQYDAIHSVVQPAITGLNGAIHDVISGAKSADEAFQGLLSSFLEMISQQSALEAAKEFASAIASAAREDWPGFGLHLAAGVAWTAVAVASGAASVAVAPPAAASPQSPQQQQSQEQQSAGTTVLNINGPILSSGSQANLGKQLGQLIDMGNKRYGRQTPKSGRFVAL